MIRKNILVTGCGGDIGQSIAKILLDEGGFNLIGTDTHLDHVGKFLFKKIYDIPKCNEAGYSDKLKEIIHINDINLIIPTSEPELKKFHKEKLLKNFQNLKVIHANDYAMEIGFDKLKTARFLEINNFPFPNTEKFEDVENIYSKKVIKSISGSGSKNVSIIEDNYAFKKMTLELDKFIVQEYIKGDEYTCGLYKGKNTSARSIIFKRELMPGGVTGKGEVVRNDMVENLLHQLANKLKLIGSINVQLRIRDNVPYIFEINPRYSSTVYFRHEFGFKDLIWSILDSYNFPVTDFHNNSFGKKFYRGYTEYFE